RRGIFSLLMTLAAAALTLAQIASMIDLVRGAVQDPQLLAPALQNLSGLFADGLSGELPADFMGILGSLNGPWINIFTQGLSLLAALGVLRRSRR
ncbi:MAG: hypothetical protein ABIF09_05925, partial [Gemmatimonadota bacterium]